MKHVLIACVVVAALAVPGSAIPARSARAATTYTVYLGEFAPPTGEPHEASSGTINQFLPSKLVIAAGDSVTFSSASFHTVTYTPKPIPLLAAGSRKGDVRRARRTQPGTPFYFDDLGKLIYNPLAFGPFGPKTISGKTPASSGAIGPAGAEGAAGDRDVRVPEAGDVHACSAPSTRG